MPRFSIAEGSTWLPASSRFGLDPIDFQDTYHFRIMRDFCSDPHMFMEEALRDDDD